MFNNFSTVLEDVRTLRERGSRGAGPLEGFPREALLVRYTKYSTPRVKKYVLRAIARRIVPDERVHICGVLVVPKQNVEIWQSPKYSKAFYKNLASCGSVWTCAVCASKITERRRVEIAGVIEKTDLNLTMGTFTLQHSLHNSLDELRHVLLGALGAVFEGSPWQRISKKHGIFGYIRNVEVTWGRVSGWHLHAHIVFFCERPVDVEGIQADFYARYLKIIQKNHFYASSKHGVTFELGDKKVGDYVSKWGLDFELAKSNVKKASDGYSPWELLELAADNPWAARLFKEYVKVMKGCHQLEWSQGLRRFYKLEKLKSDAELAVENSDSSDLLLVRLSLDAWMIVLANDATAELLDVADSGDVVKLEKFMFDLGIDSIGGAVQ